MREIKYWCDGYYSDCLYRQEQTVIMRRGYHLFVCSSKGNYNPDIPCRHALWSYADKPDMRHWVVKRPPKLRLHGEPRLLVGKSE